LRGRQKKNANAGKPELPKPEPKPVVLDYANTPKLCVHYNEGKHDAARGYKPAWFDDEATEWKCVERDAYRVGYRTVKKDN
jgi:hypothetical protein